MGNGAPRVAAIVAHTDRFGYSGAMTRHPTILFDLDGTLIDSVRLILDSYAHTLAAHGLPPCAEAELRRTMGVPLRAQLATWARDEAHLDALVATYRAHNLAWHDRLVVAYDGVVEAVRALAARGVAIGVVTGKTHEGAVRGLRLVGLLDAVGVILGCDDVARPKPHPEHALAALAALGRPAEGAILVGDSLHDLACGRAAGLRVAAVTWGACDRDTLAAGEPDVWIERPEQLAGL